MCRLELLSVLPAADWLLGLVADGVDCREVLRRFWLRQLPVDEDQIHERTQNTSNRRSHQWHPEPVIVTPKEQNHTFNNLIKLNTFKKNNTNIVCYNILLHLSITILN